MPRSIRPGAAASSSANCSATASGAWLGSITPPEPSRIGGLRGEVGDQHRRAGGRNRRHVVVLGQPVAGVPEVVGVLRHTVGGARASDVV